MNNLPPIILFDGYCHLCSGLIKFLSKRSYIIKPIFIASQSDEGKKYIEKYELIYENETVYLIMKGIVYSKSTAIIKIFSIMKGIWKNGKYFIIISPKIRDYIYNIIARYRFRIFGKRATCYIPPEN